jgi:uncharacterized paraquat-inducible protein A
MYSYFKDDRVENVGVRKTLAPLRRDNAQTGFYRDEKSSSQLLLQNCSRCGRAMNRSNDSVCAKCKVELKHKREQNKNKK